MRYKILWGGSFVKKRLWTIPIVFAPTKFDYTGTARSGIVNPPLVIHAFLKLLVYLN
jgi:hypothetical protein